MATLLGKETFADLLTKYIDSRRVGQGRSDTVVDAVLMAHCAMALEPRRECRLQRQCSRCRACQSEPPTTLCEDMSTG